ncbi:MAG: ABC transporter substrate-binding protein [Hyphomicrobiales bacterium]
MISANILRPKSQLESCTKDGKVYCVPVNLHSAQWMWTNRKVFEDAGIAPPQNWNELVAAAPKLQEKGIQPLSLAQGWPVGLLVNDVAVALAGVDNFVKVYKDRDVALASGPEFAKVFDALAAVRQFVPADKMVPQWERSRRPRDPGQGRCQHHGRLGRW